LVCRRRGGGDDRRHIAGPAEREENPQIISDKTQQGKEAVTEPAKKFTTAARK
jgi:hypothetical protein